MRDDRESERLIVTLHVRDKPVNADELAEIRRLVEEASEGFEFEIVLSEEDGPTTVRLPVPRSSCRGAAVARGRGRGTIGRDESPEITRRS